MQMSDYSLDCLSGLLPPLSLSTRISRVLGYVQIQIKLAVLSLRREHVDATRSRWTVDEDSGKFGTKRAAFLFYEVDFDCAARAIAMWSGTNNRRDCRAGCQNIRPAGASDARHTAVAAPERQILLFHGIVNLRQRVLMPRARHPGGGRTHTKFPPSPSF